MEHLDNLQTTSEEQKYIPLEVNAESKEFLISNGYDLSKDAVWKKIGNRYIRAIMIPVTKEVYHEYMKPIWREEKRNQRASKQEDERKMKPVSLDQLYDDTDYEISSNFDLEEEIIKQEMIKELKIALKKLEEIDQKIMDLYSKSRTECQIASEVNRSQKGVNKRKNNVFIKLRTLLKEFES
ncbi:hypothetical protein P261_02596 [Lachnospiraceae bacterium TWA4]|nr:hypothetical protein P261_02596 [Lachnospiraceae bacterium TWA4]